METKDILVIIKACKNAGVQEFADGKLRIVFSSPPDPASPLNIIKPPKLTPKAIQAMEAVEKAANEKEKYEDIDEEINNLVVTDPLQYEENLARGELVDDEAQLQH